MMDEKLSDIHIKQRKKEQSLHSDLEVETIYGDVEIVS